MILLEEMKLLEEQQKSDEVKQNHIKLLLETAKVDIPQQQSQKVVQHTMPLLALQTYFGTPSQEGNANKMARSIVTAWNITPREIGI